MKSISTLFRQLSLIVVLISAFSLSAWGGEEATATLTFDNTSKRTSFSTTKQVWTENGITLTNDKSESTSNVADYSNPARFYKNSKIIIEAPGNITTIVFDCNSNEYATAMKNSIDNTTIVSSDNDKVTVTLDGTSNTYTIESLSSGQVRLDAITVTYQSEGSTDPIEPTPSLIPSTTSIDFGDIKLNSTSTIQKTFTISGENLKGDVKLKLDNDNFSITPTTITPDDGNINQEIIVTLLKTTPKGKLKTTITISTEGNTQDINLQVNIYEPYKIYFGETEYETDADGKVIDLPSGDNTPSCNNEYPNFFGWTNLSNLGITSKKLEVVSKDTKFEQNTQLYPVFTKETTSTWALVTDAATLTIGDKIIIAAAEHNYALSTTQNSNNRGQASITKRDNTITFGNDVQILTLEAGTKDGTFAFNTGNGYLYTASSSSNHLKTQATLSDNSSWKITIADGVATVVAQGSNTRKTMQYNQSSSLFACYESASQKAIALYQKVDGEETEYYICGDLTIESGTTHNVTEKIALSTLTIKSNLDEAGQVAVTSGSGSLTAQKVVVEKTIDASRYFFFSLPFDCKISDIVATDANGKELEYAKDAKSGEYVINQYNQIRAEGKDKAWKELLGTEHKLNANQGYIIGHFGKGDVTVKFHSTEAQTISAPADKTLDYTDTWFVDGENSSKGFNLIGMPYYQNINSTISCDSVYIYSTTPNTDGKTYTQKEYTGDNVAPFTSFFVQVKAAPTFTIETQSAAPMLRAKDVVAKATITLADANGGADETTVINNPTKTTDYEIGHDLVKWIGYAEIPQIYSIQGEDILAFNSLAMNNETIIPLGVYAHADGDYTFSLSDKSMGNLEGWELYDSESGKAVALTDESLTVTLSKGTHEGRFSIRMEQGTTTDCECDMSNIVTYMNNGTFYIENMPTKAMVYIYDAVGRMIYATETTYTSFDYTFALRGVYNVVVCTEYNSIAYKTIY